MTAAPRINGARALMASRQQKRGSLDLFCTPPWATRALCVHALPQLGVSLARATVWEPACGKGHMSEVLGEYARSVIATDVRNYRGNLCNGSWAGCLDFLRGEHAPGYSDWIVTNPPFGAKAVPFVLRALDLARTGVAMFFRSQWAVEGIERYQTIFRDRPPTLMAFFSERVPLCKGRWDPDGTTATAYCWLVWMRGKAPQPPFWIPPGCRAALTSPDDRARFAGKCA
jgi:hypothetical protein